MTFTASHNDKIWGFFKTNRFCDLRCRQTKRSCIKYRAVLNLKRQKRCHNFSQLQLWVLFFFAAIGNRNKKTLDRSIFSGTLRCVFRTSFLLSQWGHLGRYTEGFCVKPDKWKERKSQGGAWLLGEFPISRRVTRNSPVRFQGKVRLSLGYNNTIR